MKRYYALQAGEMVCESNHKPTVLAYCHNRNYEGLTTGHLVPCVIRDRLHLLGPIGLEIEQKIAHGRPSDEIAALLLKAERAGYEVN